MKNIIQLLFDKTHIDSEIWRFPNEDISVTVTDLGEQVKNYAKFLKSKGVKQGDRIGIILDNSYGLVCLLYATWYLNAVAVPLRSRSGRYHDYQKYLKHCDEISSFKLVIYEGESISEELTRWTTVCNKPLVSIEEITNSAKEGQPTKDLDAEIVSPKDIALIQFSSGSTGDPKGVVVTHRMMMAQLQNIEDNHARSRGNKVASSASWLPINHDMGLFIGVLSPIFSACDNLLSTPAYYMKNPSRWFGLLSKYKVDFTFSTNSVLASSLNFLRRLRKSTDNQTDGQSSIDLSNLHLYIAAEKVSPVIVRRAWDCLSEFNCPKENIHVGYGMAENTLGATYTTSGPIKMHWFVLNQDGSLSLSGDKHSKSFELASIGVPNDHHKITVRDCNDAILPELTLGEFSIESPCVSPAYYNNQKETDLKLGNGRLRTGDLGFRFDGEYYFYSRVDDLIIVGGRNIVPDDVESTVESMNFVRSGGSTLLGIEHQQLGVTQLHLLVEGNEFLTSKAIKNHSTNLRQHILGVHDLLIKDISFCTKGSIEKTSSGKKRRKVIRQRILDSEISFLQQRNPMESPSRSGQEQTTHLMSAEHEYQATV